MENEAQNVQRRGGAQRAPNSYQPERDFIQAVQSQEVVLVRPNVVQVLETTRPEHCRVMRSIPQRKTAQQLEEQRVKVSVPEMPILHGTIKKPLIDEQTMLKPEGTLLPISERRFTKAQRHAAVLKHEIDLEEIQGLRESDGFSVVTAPPKEVIRYRDSWVKSLVKEGTPILQSSLTSSEAKHRKPERVRVGASNGESQQYQQYLAETRSVGQSKVETIGIGQKSKESAEQVTVVNVVERRKVDRPLTLSALNSK